MLQDSACTAAAAVAAAAASARDGEQRQVIPPGTASHVTRKKLLPRSMSVSPTTGQGACMCVNHLTLVDWW
ncbi:hypothetical protein EON62_04425 [archaeon]|nr:MAG: hypothetical protein EON62_04425 [archaeon]